MPIDFSSTRRLVVLVAFAALTGCGAAPDQQSAGIDGDSLAPSIQSLPGALPGALSVQDDGLEVRKWLIDDNASSVAAALVTFGEEAPMDGRTRDVLARNGLRIWRAPYAAVDAVRDRFGGAAIDQQWWFGQAPQWTELHARSLGGRSRGVAVEGRVRSFRSGTFSLLMRSWTMKTHEGPRTQFELVPFYSRSDVGGFRRALQMEDPGEIFPELLAQLSMELGYAYFLTCETPGVDWIDLAADRAEPRQPLQLPEGADVRGTIGPDTSVGPDLGGPWTLGEALLRGSAEVGNRGVIVLIPHLPERLFPVEMLPELGADGGAEEAEPAP